MELVEKDLKKVVDYNRQRQLDIFKGQCFNNASLFFPYFYEKCAKGEDIADMKAMADFVFEFADILYKKGLQKEWV